MVFFCRPTENLVVILFNNLALIFMTETGGIKQIESHLFHTELSNDVVYFTGCQ